MSDIMNEQFNPFTVAELPSMHAVWKIYVTAFQVTSFRNLIEKQKHWRV